MPLDPGWAHYRTGLEDEAARLALASETSLFPGSLVARRRDNEFLIHCLDRSQDVSAAFEAEEKRIARIAKAATSGGRV